MTDQEIIENLALVCLVREKVVENAFEFIKHAFNLEEINTQEIADIIVYQIKNQNINPDDVFSFIFNTAPLAAFIGVSCDEFIALWRHIAYVKR